MKRFELFSIGAVLLSAVCAALCYPPGSMRYLTGDPNIQASTLPSGVGIWLKAEDITVNTGTVITNWPDSSGNNWEASRTSVNPPGVSSNVLNGFNVVENDNQDGLDWVDSEARDLFKNAEAATVFIVAKPTSVSAGYPVLFFVSQGDAGYPPRFDLRYAASAFEIEGSRLDSDSVKASDYFTLPLNTWYIFEAIASWTNSDALLWTNGVAAIADTSWGTAGNTSDTTPQAMTIGTYAHQSGETWVGQIAEVIIYNRRLTTDELDQIRVYLNGKFEIY